MTGPSGVAAWLFVKAHASVRLVRVSHPPALVVLGPGQHRERHRASDDHQLNALHAAVEARLRREGWAYEGVGVERRTGADRRGTRGWPERRLRDS